MAKNKTVVLGVTGSIAAYKAAGLASMLKKKDYDVHVIMTKNALNFINPITFETLTGNKCLVDTFDRNFQYNVEHVALAKRADIFITAPASANVIGKLASGIADDMLTTVALACKCKKVIAPAMNTNMYENPIVGDNLKKLEKYGFEIVQPSVGRLACGDTGAGKLPSEEELFEYIERELAYDKDLRGLKVLVTAGATREKLDPVRYISNRSTGKMGIALAKAAMLRGAEVTLICAAVTVPKPRLVKCIDVESAEDMLCAVKAEYKKQDIIIKAAAVADYRPINVSDEKIKKSGANMSLELERTTDILGFLGDSKKEGQYLCGFSMETQNLTENSRKKLEKKNADMIVANNLKQKGAGFGTDTNIVTMITEYGEEKLELMSKEDVAHKILDKIMLERMKIND